MVSPKKVHPFTLCLLFILILYFTAQAYGFTLRLPFNKVSGEQLSGFDPVECWFTPRADWPDTECYLMNVPEDHAQPSGRVITYPVIVFRSRSLFATRSPVLHLGAGGPGAPMYLDSTESVEAIWQYHDAMSLDQGRDLFVIDPRGTGLAKPRLTCDTYVESELIRLEKNLPVREEWAQVDEDYFSCINRLRAEGVGLAHYNSLSIAQDVEMMRRAARVDSWVLLGVSYAAIYAQLIATEFPDSVESMVLDSAAFPNLKLHDNYLEQTTSAYRALYGHCNINPECRVPLHNVEQRLWALHKRLNVQPLNVVIEHPYEDKPLSVLLNGERFLAALMSGIYGVDIYSDLPAIIVELEAGVVKSIKPYLADHAAYVLDRYYGDISTSTHYCFEDKAFTDFKLISQQIDQLPEGYIREMATFALDWPDYCDAMSVDAGPDRVANKTETAVPVLFLHGRFDIVTPLSHVESQREGFKNSRLVSYDLAHGILSRDECAERVAAMFIADNTIEQKRLDCR